jgi:L-threonylcarbamoyladenylate synthase
VRAVRDEGGKVGALLLSPPPAEPPIDHPIAMPDDPTRYARRLYAALHELDDAGCTVILAERPPTDPRWVGVRDRLERAAR